MVRTRFAPSPTGYMHIGNLRTALYEYLIAKSQDGKFILRIEDTDKERQVEGATEVIYNTLRMTGLIHDEGPDVGGDYGPYIQSERKPIYMEYAKKLIDNGCAYYCFCTKERLAELDNGEDDISKYDRHCLNLSQEKIEENLEKGIPFVIRQKISTEGTTTFSDEVYGDISVPNETLDDQILMKSDGFPTYNFANVVDDHLMGITHVVRGAEYLSSTPKYNLLYDAFGFPIPTYIHLPPVMKNKSQKLSKRNGDASFEDLIEMGYIVPAILNYIAFLGWAPEGNEEFFTLSELIEKFNVKGLSKSPAIFDMKKLTWMNSEYFKRMDDDEFYNLIEERLKENIKKDVDYKKLAVQLKTRLEVLNDVAHWVAFVDNLPEYSTGLYCHKKMKTDETIALKSLEDVLPVLTEAEAWDETVLHDKIMELVVTLGIKNGQMLWPLRTALSGQESSPGGAIELLVLLGKEESIKRVQIGIEKLKCI